jgi:Asp-tRNA(Asn)/Glu-tRNA(Gln) amidotransferase A subunit family amidase
VAFPDYESYDATGLADLVRRRETTAAELLEAALERAAARNPRLNAIVIPMEDAARQAVARGLPDGPLRGVPFLVKDLLLQIDGQRTTNGCRLFADHVADHDSELVTRYERAGLVTFGRTASPEFGLTTTTESTLFGQTRNPWNEAHTAGGSSGGAAAAVAAGILPLANASDGGGSIRIPASCCGIFGMKPTRGRTPFGPDVGEGWSGMSTIHAVSRSVRDNALLLDVSEGPERGSPYWAPPKERPYVEEVGRAPGTLRVALLTETFNGMPTDAACVAAVEEAGKLCESLGHRVEPRRIEVDREALALASQAIMGGNLIATLEDRAAALGRTLGPDDVEPFTWGSIERARTLTAADYARAVRGIHGVGRRIDAVFEEVDVILTPTLAAPPERLGVLSLSNTDLGELVPALLRSVGYTQVFNASGHPAMSVPLHWSPDGLPVGVQFAGRFGDEGTLFRLAGQLETARPWADRRPPV